MLTRWRGWLKSRTNPFLFPAVPVIAALIFLALWLVPRWQMQSFRARFDPELVKRLDADKQIQLEKDLITTETNARTTLAQMLGGLVLLAGLYLTWRNVRVTEEGKLTDRFSKAVEMLGSDKLDVRLGGIYALERIARDSQHDHWTIMEILTAYVREHACKNEKIEERGDGKFLSKAPADIQAIVDVLGRRKWVESEKLNQRINLVEAYLAHVSFEKGNFIRADLSWANLEGADLSYATLNKANLLMAKLPKASLREAKLEGAILIAAEIENAFLVDANLKNARLENAKLQKTNLAGANLEGANLEGANLEGTNLRGAKGLAWEQIDAAIINKSTQLPPEFDELKKAKLAEQLELRYNAE